MFEIKDRDINVEQIKEKIEDNIKKSKQDRNYIKALEDIMRIKNSIPDNPLQYIKKYYLIDCYSIAGTRRKVIGPIIVKIKEFLYRRIRDELLSSMIAQQIQFNRSVVKLIDKLNNEIEDLKNQMNNLKRRLM